MTSSRMSDRNRPLHIEVKFWSMLDHGIGGCRDVEIATGITAAGAVGSAIVDVPYSDAAALQIEGDPVHQVPIGNVGLPASTMDHQDGGERAGAPWEPDIPT